MNAVSNFAPAGYGSAIVRTPRDIEYAVFSRVTTMLREALVAPISPAAVTAIHKNTELWTTLAFDLADDRNALPVPLRAGLLSLAGFAIRQGNAAISGRAQIQPLIDINLSIMKGLRGTEAAS